MKISVVQFKPEFGEISVNIEFLKNIIEANDSEIIIFPELCLSGYDFKSKNEALELSQSANSEVLQEFQHISSTQEKIINFGFAEKIHQYRKNFLFNASILINPDPELTSIYRKVHLFFREKFIFDEGYKGYSVVRDKKRDINIGQMICYDWRFPEAARSLALKGADLITCPSNLVTNVWHIATPARALENKVYFAVANRIGSEQRNSKELYFNGMSKIYNYNGSELASASQTEKEIITAEIEPSKTRKKSFNDFNDIFRDRRSSQYYLG